jgi:hypothetical protein
MRSIIPGKLSFILCRGNPFSVGVMRRSILSNFTLVRSFSKDAPKGRKAVALRGTATNLLLCLFLLGVLFLVDSAVVYFLPIDQGSRAAGVGVAAGTLLFLVVRLVTDLFHLTFGADTTLPLGGAGETSEGIKPSEEEAEISISVPLPMQNPQDEGEDGPLHMVGGGRLELDLNRSADPEMTHPIPYQKCMDKLTGVVTRLRVSVKEDLFPNYDRRPPIRNNDSIHASLADFLKQRDPDSLQGDAEELERSGKKAPIFHEFFDYQLKKQKSRQE